MDHCVLILLLAFVCFVFAISNTRCSCYTHSYSWVHPTREKRLSRGYLRTIGAWLIVISFVLILNWIGLTITGTNPF